MIYCPAPSSSLSVQKHKKKTGPKKAGHHFNTLKNFTVPAFCQRIVKPDRQVKQKDCKGFAGLAACFVKGKNFGKKGKKKPLLIKGPFLEL
jgi:hypothetical protein